jgi:hypothetical protein
MKKDHVRWLAERELAAREMYSVEVRLSGARSRMVALSADGEVLHVSLPVARVNPPNVLSAAITQLLDGRDGRAVVYRRPPAKFEAACPDGHTVLSRNVRNDIAGLVCTRCGKGPLTWRRRCSNTSPFSEESVY